MYLKIFLLLALSFPVAALSQSEWLKVGDVLSALSFEAEPDRFSYSPNGYRQMVSVYKASITSSRNGKFNAQVIQEGFCPLTIIDIKNRAWYAPAKAAIDFVTKSVESEAHNPLCRTSMDLDGVALQTWALPKKSTTMIVDGKGKILFMAFGILNEMEEKKVIELLRQGGKPFDEWPGNPAFQVQTEPSVTSSQ